MTVPIDQVVVRCRVTREELDLWIERRWVRPIRTEGVAGFSETDIARTGLIADLVRDIGVGEEAMDVILPLIDQVYALRREMRLVTEAVAALPEDARNQVLTRIAERAGR